MFERIGVPKGKRLSNKIFRHPKLSYTYTLDCDLQFELDQYKKKKLDKINRLQELRNIHMQSIQGTQEIINERKRQESERIRSKIEHGNNMRAEHIRAVRRTQMIIKERKLEQQKRNKKLIKYQYYQLILFWFY